MMKNEAKGSDLEAFAETMMAAFVRVVDEAAEAHGFKKAEFAQKVWPESSPRAASSRWQTMRTMVTNTGKPQGVLITDAQRMATILEQDLPYLFLKAQALAKEMEAAQKEAAPARRRRGRPKPHE